jgi:hypothetical protein
MVSAWAQSSSTNPVVSYATFFGGGTADYYESEGGYGIALGPGGTVYVLGYTGTASSFPLTNRFGPDWQEFGTFVIKYDPASRAVLYSSLIRGCWGRAIAVDSAGNAYVTGHATYYTATTNAFQADFQGGNYDAFVAKLSADGASLLYCTFLGGENEDVGRRIVVDAAGQAIVTGTTASTNFPVTAGVVQPRLAGIWNAFVTKLDASGSNLVFSTYLGGACFDYGLGLALDSSNNVFVSGSSCSTNFASAPHPLFLGTNELGADAFVAKLSPDARAVRWVTFFGGDGDQLGSALALDGAGNAYVFGQTSASNFPVTAGCLQSQYGGGAWDNFVVKLNSSGSNLAYATYLGGASADDQREDMNLYGPVWNGFDLALPVAGITVDASGNAYVAGRSASIDIGHGAERNQFVGNWDGYVAKVNPTGSRLLYLRFLGCGSYPGFSTASAVVADTAGNVFLTGVAGATYLPPFFPTTPGAFQAQFGGSMSDAYLAQLSEAAPLSPNDAFASRVPLRGLRMTVPGENLAASKEPGEPMHAGNAGGKSVWWSWTADANGVLKLSTDGSSVNTLLAVYLGTAVTNLQLVASNAASPSLVQFPVIAGKTYQIAVDGRDGASGSISLSLDFSLPPNDDFANRIPIPGFPAMVTGSNVNATLEPGEPGIYFWGRSVWWTWTSPLDGPVDFSTAGSTFDTVLALYTGSSIGDLTGLPGGWNDNETNGVLTSRVSIQAQAGTTYQIQVTGANDFSGAIQLTITNSTPPPNDNFDNRTVLSGSHVTITNYNWGATTEPGEPTLGIPYPGGKTLWWTWTAPSNGWVNLSTAGSGFDARLGVLIGSTLTNQVRVAANDNAGFSGPDYLQARVQFEVTSNMAYNIVVDGIAWDPAGRIVLNLDFSQPPKITNFPSAWVPGTPFHFRVLGLAGQSYRIQTSTNLADWTVIPSTNLLGPVFDFSDTNAIAACRRFYRVIEAQ